MERCCHAELVLFAYDVKTHKQENTRCPCQIGNPSGIIGFYEGRQVIEERKTEIAQQQKQVSEAIRGPSRRKLIQGQRILEKEEDKTEADENAYVENDRKNLFRVEMQEITDQDGQDPGNGNERAGLGSVPRSLREQGGIQHIGSCQDKKEKQIEKVASGKLDAAEKRKKV